LQTITQYQATTSGGPNFAYDLCVRKVSSDQIGMLDLSSWQVAFNGAEPVRADTLERFATTFEPCGFRRQAFQPCYGLAESTLIVSGLKQSSQPLVKTFQAKELERNHLVETSETDEDGRSIVSSGAVPEEHKVVIVNPDSLKQCLADEVGEIWVAGPSVAQGYWNEPDETKKTFNAHLSDDHEESFLRTGDLGFLSDGELFIAGRLKDLIIIRGRNHHPQDIERTVEQSHPALRPDCGAAFSVELAGEEQLVVVQEVEPRQVSNAGDIIEKIRDAVALEHEVQVYAVVLIRPRKLPKTSSGKLQRQACRAMFLEGTLESIAEQRRNTDEQQTKVAGPPLDDKDAVAGWLVSTIAAKLGVDPQSLNLERPISSYHLDSLSAVELTHSIQSTLGVDLPLVNLLQDLTISQLAAMTAGLATASKAPPAGPPATEFRLSHGQEALWYLHEMAPESSAYLISTAVRIRTELDVKALQSAFQKLMERHAALRTTFSASGDHPLQRIQQDMPLPFAQQDASEWSESVLHEQLNLEAHAPFNLTQGPLWRVRLFTRSAQEHILLLVAHHIICDFWSLTVLTHELGMLYQAEKTGTAVALSPLEWQYADFVHWQNEMLASPEGDRLLVYWQEQLAGELPVLDLPLDRPRPLVQTYRGATEGFTIDPRPTEGLKSLGHAHSATLYATLLAIFQVLLHRHTGQEDILVGSPMAGRERAETAGLVGYFVNPVVLRAHISPLQTFESLLDHVRQTGLEALEHQHFPFPLIVEQVQPTRDSSRSPIFQCLFVFQKAHLLNDAGLSLLPLGTAEARLRVGGLELESVALQQPVAQFDLTLMMAEANGQIAASFIYNTDLFDAATIKRLADHFQCLVEDILAHPSSRISELKVLSDGEYQQIVHEWNQTQAPYPSQASLHTLFEQQVERTPDAIALSFADTELSYQELNARANQLAHYLRRLGTGPESHVGVLLERSLELVVGLLGILKAGGAYVPLDSSYPAERLAFMQEDSRLSILLTQDRLRASLPDSSARAILIDTQWDEISRERQDNPSVTASPDNQAYMIYTSGSTGRPKGAMNTHRALCNRLHWMQEQYGLTSSDRVLQKTPASFDVSVWEFFWPLLYGARLVMAAPGAQSDSKYLVEVISREAITTLHFVPSMLQVFLEEPGTTDCVSLQRVICSGEALSVDLQERFFARLNAELHNLYGPTEAAIDVTYWQCEPDSRRSSVPIGRPIANTQIYVLDEGLQPVPIGVIGELHIGGVGLARGYFNRPHLTGEKFIPNPFGEAGTRLYRTGDLVRFLPGGEIEFLARVDQQIKLRGYRIELGEIETALAELAGVREAVVLLRTAGNDEKHLAAFVGLHGGANSSSTQLRSQLADRLPDYMIPSVLMILDEMPLTPNGKTDRAALLAMEVSSPAGASGYIAPRNPTEETLREIWAEVLGVKQVGVEDNFFELGGHSIMATRIAARVREKLNAEISLAMLFDGPPTIAQMAKAIDEYFIEQAKPEELDGMLKELAELSDEEIRMLLASTENANWD